MSNSTLDIRSYGVNVNIDANKTLDLFLKEGKSQNEIKYEDEKIKKDYDRMVWAKNHEQVDLIRHEARSDWYQQILNKWSQQRCSPITWADTRKQTENAIIKHASTFNPDNVQSLQNVFSEDQPCGKNQYVAVRNFLSSMKFGNDKK